MLEDGGGQCEECVSVLNYPSDCEPAGGKFHETASSDVPRYIEITNSSVDQREKTKAKLVRDGGEHRVFACEKNEARERCHSAVRQSEILFARSPLF